MKNQQLKNGDLASADMETRLLEADKMLMGGIELPPEAQLGEKHMDIRLNYSNRTIRISLE